MSGTNIRPGAGDRGEFAAASLDLGAVRLLLAENDYLRVRMMVAVSFLDSEALDRFHEHVAELDAGHREISRNQPELDPKVADSLFRSVLEVDPLV